MKMTSTILVGTWLGLFTLAFAQTQSGTSSKKTDATAETLKAISQELMDAVAQGNKAVWESYLSEDCLYVDENGSVSTKSELLKDFGPLPAGYVGRIEVTDPQVRTAGDTAVITHRDMEYLELYGQKMLTQFQTTSTFVRQNGQWQMIFSHVSVLPSELTPVSLDPNIYDRYTGEYELAPSVVYTVKREGDKLTGQRTGREKEELFPTNETTFFRKGNPRGVKIFAADNKGNVTHLIDRRDNNDLIWKSKQS